MTLPMPAPPIIPGIPPPMSAERSGIPAGWEGPRAAASIASNLADKWSRRPVKTGVVEENGPTASCEDAIFPRSPPQTASTSRAPS